MAFRKYAEKLDNYYERLSQGKVKKIKPHHIEKVISKLRKKELQLAADIEQTEKPSKKERLEHKRLIAHEHIARAEWLLEKIRPSEG